MIYRTLWIDIGSFISQLTNQKRVLNFFDARKKLHGTELDHKEIPATAKSMVFFTYYRFMLYILSILQEWACTMTYHARTPTRWSNAPTGPSPGSGPWATPVPGTGPIRTTLIFSGLINISYPR